MAGRWHQYLLFDVHGFADFLLKEVL